MTVAHAHRPKEPIRIQSYPVPDAIPDGTYNVTTKDGKKVATQIPGFTEKRPPEPEEEINGEDSKFPTWR